MNETNSTPLDQTHLVAANEESLSLLHDFPMPVWRSGPDGRCDYFNKVWLEFTGRSLEDELGDGWLHAVHSEEVERVIWEHRSAFDQRVPFTLEYRLRRHDGIYRNVVDRGQPYTQPDGTFAGYIGSCYDITKRLEVEQSLRETETRFRQLAKNIDAVFWLGTPEMTRIDYISPAFEKIWGRTCESLYHHPRSWVDSKLKEKEAEVAETNEKLRLLTNRLVKVQEDERRSLAYKLHDEVGQTLSAVKIGLEAARKNCDRPSGESQLNESLLLVDQVLRQVRQIALDLRPSLLDHLGLVPALRWYFDQQSRRSELQIDFRHSDVRTPIPTEIQTACYRIAQEAMTNILRHAVATHVAVELRELNGILLFTLTDDGIGFDFEQSKLQASLGLLGMKERAAVGGGSLEVISQLTKGTTILVRLPLEAPAVQVRLDKSE